MPRERVGRYAPAVVAVTGATLFVLAVAHHFEELRALDSFGGPLLALLLDGVPGLALVYCGHWIRGADLDPEHRWPVAGACVLGAVVSAGVVEVSVVIRQMEGRTVGEPAFALLLAAEAGALAGCVAGYFYGQARQNTAQAREATRTLSFVNGLLTHDLRNDLTTIEAESELLAADAEDRATVDRAESIRDTVYESAELIDNAGAIAAAIAEDGSTESVDVTTLVEETIDRTVDATDATVETDLPDCAKVLATDALRSVVGNLVENAIEHGDSEEPTVEVSVEPVGDQVRLRVADDGPGIPDDHKETVFETRDDASHGGGLSLVSTLVDRYGGRVWVEDNEPRGSVFVVELPRAETAAQGGD